jgi:phosphate starvation-inducible membrane PsiE
MMDTEPSKASPRLVRVLEASELILYSAVAVLLVVIAIISLVAEITNIATYLTSTSPILGVQELLVTIIILELLMTVVGYLKTKSINLRLLLGAGLTAMIRQIITAVYVPLAAQDFALVLLATAILVAAIIFVGNRTIQA